MASGNDKSSDKRKKPLQITEPSGSTKRKREDDKQTTGNPSKKQVPNQIHNTYQIALNDKAVPARNKEIALNDKGDSPRTPRNRTPGITHSEITPPSSIDSKSGGRVVQHDGNNAIANGGGGLLTFEGGTGVNVSVDLCDGEFVLKIKRRKISSSTDDNDMLERQEQIAQSAGKLLLHAELIREMGEQLLAQYRASVRSIFRVCNLN